MTQSGRVAAVLPEVPKAPEVTEPETIRTDGSMAKYKIVDEIWDNATYRYKIVDSFERTLKKKDLVDYVFIVRWLDWSKEVRVRGRKVFTLDCHYLGYDGDSLGDISISLGIQEFRGEEKIKSLDVFPLNYHVRAEEVRTNLITLGQKFISLRGIHHLEHNGFVFIRKDGNVHMMYMKGRVMIDAGSFKWNHPSHDIPKIKADPFGMYTIIENPERDLNHITMSIEPDDVKEESLLTCSLTVFGFSFKSKGWAEFAISCLEEIHWDLNPF
ncbi:MAG: hypothetical protein M1840_005738 [Geoglossum simile]|nr:MAG: hypothetical protein M1840_005738 [Geoglossum simile]